MSAFLPILLNWLQQYGYLALWPTMFLAAVGLPLPSSLLLLAAGAFAALGDFNVVLLAAVALSAFVCGDSTGYFIGRRGGSKVLHWLEKPKRKWQRIVPEHTIARSREYFDQHGGWAIFLTRFLFGALGGVVNLLAGAELFPYRPFLLYDFTGEILSVVLPLSLGYAFEASWEAVGDIMGAFSVFAFVLLVVILVTIQLVKPLHRINSRVLPLAPRQALRSRQSG